MTKISIYEGNSFVVNRTYDASLTLGTTLEGFSVFLTVKERKDAAEKLIYATGEVSGTGVTFTVPAEDNHLNPGTYYFENTATSTTNKVTLELDRLLVKESIVFTT